jgi:type 1 glutamine amidotransferase
MLMMYKGKITIHAVLLAVVLMLVAGFLCSCCGCGQSSKDLSRPGEDLKVLVVTGGHDFEHEPFISLFEGYEDIEYVEAQLKDDSEIFEDITGWDYDVIVFFNMTQKISPKRQENFKKLVKEGVGVVALHHCMGSYQEWPEYIKIIGGRYNLKASEQGGVKHEASTYKHDADFTVRIEDTKHPITRGLSDFEVHDETYKKCSFDKDNHLLLTTSHPDSDTEIGWVRRYGGGKVCFIMVGHGPSVYGHPTYRQLVARAIRWSAN